MTPVPGRGYRGGMHPEIDALLREQAGTVETGGAADRTAAVFDLP